MAHRFEHDRVESSGGEQILVSAVCAPIPSSREELTASGACDRYDSCASVFSAFGVGYLPVESGIFALRDPHSLESPLSLIYSLSDCVSCMHSP